MLAVTIKPWDKQCGIFALLMYILIAILETTFYWKMDDYPMAWWLYHPLHCSTAAISVIGLVCTLYPHSKILKSYFIYGLTFFGGCILLCFGYVLL
eukprot:UN18043